MNKIPKVQYSPEFRAQAVKTFNGSNLSIAESAKRLSIPKSTLLAWVTADKKGQLSTCHKSIYRIRDDLAFIQGAFSNAS